MPKYDYKCGVCGIEYEAERSIHAEASAPICCGAPMNRVYNSFGLSFKGGGFYSTGG